MSPAFVPSIKDLAAQLRIDEAERILRHVLRLKTTAQVKRFMSETLKQIAPNLSLLVTE
ncbi:MAG: hypothetical protein IH991_07540 [Planctomycetes bacterium]|nr:hypothetical protein [Planctomycetota bacterium]